MPSKVTPCVECGVRPKLRPYHRCRVCWVRSQGITVRVEESRRRSGMVPEPLRRRVVPERLWPLGTRWCGGCQSFVDLEDVAKGASQCRACVSTRAHAAMVEKTYGLSGAEYDRLLTLQDGRCAICRVKPKKKRLVVDHDHKSGTVRGLLCASCNHEGLGAFHDSIPMVAAALAYLQTPPASGAWKPPESGQAPAGASRTVAPASTARRGPERAPGDILWQPATVAELLVVGGSADENGRYRLYQRRDDPRPPF